MIIAFTAQPRWSRMSRSSTTPYAIDNFVFLFLIYKKGKKLKMYRSIHAETTECISRPGIKYSVLLAPEKTRKKP